MHKRVPSNDVTMTSTSRLFQYSDLFGAGGLSGDVNISENDRYKLNKHYNQLYSYRLNLLHLYALTLLTTLFKLFTWLLLIKQYLFVTIIGKSAFLISTQTWTFWPNSLVVFPVLSSYYWEHYIHMPDRHLLESSSSAPLRKRSDPDMFNDIIVWLFVVKNCVKTMPDNSSIGGLLKSLQNIRKCFVIFGWAELFTKLIFQSISVKFPISIGLEFISSTFALAGYEAARKVELSQTGIEYGNQIKIYSLSGYTKFDHVLED